MTSSAPAALVSAKSRACDERLILYHRYFEGRAFSTVCLGEQRRHLVAGLTRVLHNNLYGIGERCANARLCAYAARNEATVKHFERARELDDASVLCALLLANRL